MTSAVRRSLISVGLVVVAGVVFLGHHATADSTEETRCQSERRTSRAFQAGVRGGANIVRQAWGRLQEDCSKLDDLRRVIEDSLSRLNRSSRSSRYVTCRRQGLVEGAEEELERIQRDCN